MNTGDVEKLSDAARRLTEALRHHLLIIYYALGDDRLSQPIRDAWEDTVGALQPSSRRTDDAQEKR